MNSRINTLKLFSTMAAVCFIAPTFAQLGGLKNAAKNAAGNAGGNKDEKKKETSTNLLKELIEKGDKAYGDKQYKEAKEFYEKAKAASSSDYDRRTAASEIFKVDNKIKWCQGKTEKIQGFYDKKEYQEVVDLYDGRYGEKIPFEENCLCDEKMKTLIEESRKGAVSQEGQAAAKRDAKKDEEEASMYKCSDLKPDAAITDPIHLKNKQKIVFSKAQILDGKINESSFTNSFEISDDIYSRIFLENSVDFEHYNIGDCFNVAYMVRWTFDDGKTVMPTWLGLNIDEIGDETSKTSWSHRISPNVSQMSKYINIKDKYGVNKEVVAFDIQTIKEYVNIVKNLAHGTHKIKLEIVYDIPEDREKPNSSAEFHMKQTTKFGPEKILATGEFTLNVTEEGKRNLYKKVCPLYEKNEISDYNRTPFTVVSSASTLIKADKGIDWSKYTLLKIVGNPEWSYSKNRYGVILSRSVPAAAYVLNKEDGFIYRSNLDFSQENTSSGGATYGPIKTSVEPLNIEFTRAFDSFCKECIGK